MTIALVLLVVVIVLQAATLASATLTMYRHEDQKAAVQSYEDAVRGLEDKVRSLEEAVKGVGKQVQQKPKRQYKPRLHAEAGPYSDDMADGAHYKYVKS